MIIDINIIGLIECLIFFAVGVFAGVLAVIANRKKCEWEITGDNRAYLTTCGQLLQHSYIEVETDKDLKFCPFCGKEIEVVE